MQDKSNSYRASKYWQYFE